VRIQTCTAAAASAAWQRQAGCLCRMTLCADVLAALLGLRHSLPATKNRGDNSQLHILDSVKVLTSPCYLTCTSISTIAQLYANPKLPSALKQPNILSLGVARGPKGGPDAKVLIPGCSRDMQHSPPPNGMPPSASAPGSTMHVPQTAAQFQ
jgi:hypothetical protein